MTPLVYSYIRFSSPQQAKGASKERQQEAAQSWATRNNLPLADQRFYDEGLSGWTGENVKTGRLGDFLKLINEGKIARGSTLVVENLDRLSRNPDIFASLEIMKQIVTAGVRVVTLSDGMEYTEEKLKEQPFILFTIVGTFLRGQQESNLKSERVRDALERKRKNINVKKWDTSYPSWLVLDKKSNTFTIDEDKANVVRLIFSKYDSGKSTNVIAAELQQEGVRRIYRKKTKHDKGKWLTSSVYDYIINPAVIGIFQPNSRLKGNDNKRLKWGEPIKGYYPPIIDEDTFYRVNGRINARKKVRGRQSTYETNIFRGLLRCPYCGGNMILMHQKIKGYVRKSDGVQSNYNSASFVCENAHHFGRTCLRYAYKARDFESEFISFAENVHTEYSKMLVPNNNKLEQRVTTLRAKIADNDKRLKKLLPLFEADAIDQKQLLDRSAQLKTERKELDKQLLSATTVEQPAQIKFDLDALINVQLDDETSRQKLADVLGRLFDHIDVYFVGLPSRYRMIQTARKRYLEQGRMTNMQIHARLTRLLPYVNERFFIAYTKDGKPYSWPSALFKEPEFLDLWGRNAEAEFKALNLIPQ